MASQVKPNIGQTGTISGTRITLTGSADYVQGFDNLVDGAVVVSFYRPSISPAATGAWRATLTKNGGGPGVHYLDRVTDIFTAGSFPTDAAVEVYLAFDPSEYAEASHAHILADISNAGTAAALDAPESGDAAAGEAVKGNDSRLTDARTPTAHYHSLGDITDAGTAAALDVAVAGDAAAGQVVKGDDSRLSDARTPVAHTHTFGDFTGSIGDAQVPASAVTQHEGSIDALALTNGPAEAGATADQTDAEIETAYNTRVSQVSAGEKTAGTETGIRRFSPKDVADMAGVHGGGGGGGAVDSVNGQTGTVTLDADDIDDTSTVNKFATAAQLANADSAVQPGDNLSDLTNDLGYITPTEVTFENLNANGDVGTGATQVAAGNHTHAGLYDPAGTAASAVSAHEASGNPHPQYLQSESDPVFSAWDRSTGILITESQISDFGSYEPAFAKNTAFNKNFGTTAGTVAQGNDSRIANGQTAYSWGDHAGLYDSAGTASSAVSAHEAAGDPHPAYQLEATLQTEVSANSDVAANTAARHTHANKAILDATTASFLTAQETQLSRLEPTVLDNTDTGSTLTAGTVYIVDTTNGVCTLNLPTATAGDPPIVILDGNDWSANNLTVDYNTSTIEGLSEDFVCDLGGGKIEFWPTAGDDWHVSYAPGFVGATSQFQSGGDSAGATETVYANTGSNLTTVPGTIHTFELSANKTLVDQLSSGQSMLCIFTNTDSYTVTWPTITWRGRAWDADEATPYLVSLVKVGSTLYGNCIGGALA